MAIEIQPINRIARIADALMDPIMRIGSGHPFTESPQKTHRWNNQNLSVEELRKINQGGTIHHPGDPKAMPFRKMIFHTPILGGWKRYIVLRPMQKQTWYIGWIVSDNIGGISRIPIRCPMRVLIGSSNVSFFGINEMGEQISIKFIGTGIIGDKSHFAKVPLL